MQLLALLPVLALLATPSDAFDRKAHARLAAQLEKKELAKASADYRARVERDIAAGRHLATEKRVVKRGAGGCRVKGQNYTVSASASASASPSTTASSTQIANIQAAQVQTTASPSTIAAASTSPAASSSASAAKAPASSSSGSTSNGANAASLTPNGKKAGLSAGDALNAMAAHLGWWYNWAPTDEGTSNSAVQFVSTLWGGGTADATDASRLASFEALTTTPTWIIGPEEPDCATGSGSAGMTIAATATLWNTLMAPKGAAGSLLLSPSMCHQMAEDGWLKTFQGQITRDWDITNIHINKNSVAGAKADIDYYYNTYGKPIWITEFACVDDSTSFIPCTDQSEINQFISDVVDLFEGDSRVYAYAYSNGYGLGDVWPAWSNGALSQSGQAYLSAISKYH